MAFDRLSFGGTKLTATSNWVKWRISDFIVLIVSMIVNVPVYYQEPFQRQFYINDLTISHPYTHDERVNNRVLVLYSLVVPIVCIIAVWALLADKRHKWYLLYISLLGLLLSWSLNFLFTNYIKNWIGRLRPDFLSRCEPKEGLPKDTLFNAIDACTTQNTERLLEGFRTTPSGHSSESFSGLGYLYLWLSGQLITGYPQTGIWRKIVSFLPVLGAMLIALSRTQDYRHHFIDVFIGSIVGSFFGYFIYRRYFPALDDPLPFKPVLDDSEVNGLDYKNDTPLQDPEAEPLSS